MSRKKESHRRRRNKRLRVGILTSGGDCPGLNAVIRAAVKAGVGVYGFEMVGIPDGFQGFVQKDPFIPLDVRSVQGLLPKGGTILGTTNRGPFSIFFQKKKPWRELEPLFRKSIRRIEKERIDAVIAIGGDGSLSLALEFSKRGIPIVGVPKTIDNDLSATDYTFGFLTAARTATDAIDKLHTTAESHDRVLILEVMGRDAGWIALYAGIAGGADVILIPEIPFDIEIVCKRIEARYRGGSKFSIVVVAEGAVPARRFFRRNHCNRTISELVGQAIMERTGIEVRTTALGHIQRGGTPATFDRILATRYGAQAAKMVSEGQFGRMVCLRTPTIGSVPIEEAVGDYHRISSDADIIETARNIGICFGD